MKDYKMGYMDKKSKLKNEVIKKVWLNKKNYKYLDFEFKVERDKELYLSYNVEESFYISVYNCKTLILKLEVDEFKSKNDERFIFKVVYFNPQTDNDCFSINHIIGVCSEYTLVKHKHEDMGNTDIIKNQFVLRKKENYYTHVKVWVRGDIKHDNYDKYLSYEFATTEYVNYIKGIFNVKKMPRARTKKHIKDFLNKIILLENLK